MGDQSTTSRLDNEGENEATEITADDLTDPEALIEKLETVQLTEEDTEELLHEAYKVNKKLKEILRRQEEKEGNVIQMRKIRTAGVLSGHNQLSQKSPLPPITSNLPNTTRNVYTAQSASRHSPSRQSSTARNHSPQSKRSPSRRKSLGTETKPEWNSRFSYS